ncbi:MAG: hypothetical protein CMH81_03400 [Nitrospiraceae bacterium]|nr:hypothetical protein [Nitrospiraceae bacterium]
MRRGMRYQHTVGKRTLATRSIVLLSVTLVFFSGCASTPGSAKIPTKAINVQPTTFEDPFEDPFATSFTDARKLNWDDQNAIHPDPWESLNVKTFAFNRYFDRVIFKPFASGYDWIMPDSVQQNIKNVFTNLAMPRRFVNSILQGKLDGAAREFVRFAINSSIGIGGLYDIASHPFVGIDPSNEDTGQTFAVWGMGSGPYIILPFFGPSSLRDSIGLIFDTALEPLTYIAFDTPVTNPILPTVLSYGTYGTEITNARSLHLESFANIETASLDFYISVQDAYFQARQAAVNDQGGLRNPSGVLNKE